jgi:hypothetical protein
MSVQARGQPKKGNCDCDGKSSLTSFRSPKKKRPVAALVSLRKVDRESLALSTNPQFLKIIEAARKEVRAGKTTSLEALEKKFGVKALDKKMERTRKTRRSS